MGLLKIIYSYGDGLFKRIMTMDDDVIDISHMSPEEVREHLRHESDRSTCPCQTCQAICDRIDRIANCAAYQLWRDRCLERREYAGIR